MTFIKDVISDLTEIKSNNNCFDQAVEVSDLVLKVLMFLNDSSLDDDTVYSAGSIDLELAISKTWHDCWTNNNCTQDTDEAVQLNNQTIDDCIDGLTKVYLT